MKIRALRVAEVGCFTTPVALEGLSGELDVLSGPNELGKSTLLKALHTIFAEKYNSRASKLKSRLIPYSGGAPLIEVDFELGGELWQLRKRYFTSAAAELRAVGKRSIARNADAEAELELLLAAHGGGGRLGLFWVEQGHGLEPAGAGLAEPSLHSALEREVAAVANGSMVRKVHKSVRKRLSELKTSVRDQATGAYRAALQEREQVERELAEVDKAYSAAETRIQALGRARNELIGLNDPAAVELAAVRLAEAEAKVSAAEGAAQRLAAVDAAWQQQEAQRALAETMHAQFTGQLAEYAKLVGERTGYVSDFAQALERQSALAQRVATERDRLLAAQAREQELSAALLHAERSLRLQRDADRLARDKAQLDERLAETRRLTERLTQLQREHAANPVDARLLARIEAEANDIRALEAELNAQAPLLDITLAAGGGGRILLDGVALHGDTRRSLGSASIMDIAGIGRITITPAQAEQTQDTLADLAARHTVLVELLSRAGSTDRGQANTRHMARQQIERDIAEVKTRLSVLAPSGIASLEVEHLALLANAAHDDASEQPVLADIGLDLSDLAGAAASALDAKLQAARAAEAAIDAEREGHTAFARASARTEEIARRLASLDAAMPAAAERPERLDQLVRALERATAAAREALLRRDAVAEATPSPAERTALSAELLAAHAAVTSASERRHSLEREIAGYEAALERDAADGIEERRAVLRERIASATAHLARIAREVAALSLLDRLFEEHERETHDRYVAPASAALSPYLTRVFPAAELVMGKGFMPETLRRGGLPEAVTVLSDGTREQIAILARLGFAAIEAAAGRPVPVILDDALVYADDARIARMFDSITAAAARHQVIILTCRERAFAAMGGNRLRLAPWHLAA